MMQMWKKGILFVGVMTLATNAAVVPFAETFSADSANWGDSASAPLSWSATGGVDNGFASGTFNFQAAQAGDDVVIIRSSQSMGSSGGAFFGNWVTDGVTGFSTFVRHDAGVPLTFFVRFADPAGFPGAIAIIPLPVPSGEWTQINVPLPDPNPPLIFEGPFGYADIFDSIGRVQLGIDIPQSLAGTNTTVTFGLDNVSIVPEPAMLLLMSAGGLAVITRHRRLSKTS
jgi:hypothetical protein